MKKIILFGCLMTIIAVGCSSGGSGGVPVDNSRLTGDWAYVWMLGGSFITTRGTATFNGDGTATYAEVESSTGSPDPGGTFNYTAYANDRIVFEEFVGTLSNDGNFFVATDTDTTAGSPVMMMVAVKQPSGADDSALTGSFFSGRFSNTNDGATSATEINEATLVDNTPLDSTITVDEIIMPNPDPGPAITVLGYDVAPDGLTTIYDAPGGTANGQKGVVSIDGNLFINADATTANTPLVSMSVKSSSGKTNASLNGTYVLHQFMDDSIGTGNFITTMSEVTFNGDVDVSGFGTGTYTEIAKSNLGPSNPLDTNQPFTYKVDIDALGNPATFLIPDTTNGDHMYGVMSPDTSVLGVVNVDTDGPGNPTDSSVFLGVAVKK